MEKVKIRWMTEDAQTYNSSFLFIHPSVNKHTIFHHSSFIHDIKIKKCAYKNTDALQTTTTLNQF
jgi:hypothetical protein